MKFISFQNSKKAKKKAPNQPKNWLGAFLKSGGATKKKEDLVYFND